MIDTSMEKINIAGHNIGPGQPCYIVAEAGVNHNGDLRTALQLIEAAAQAGANAVKFQTFKAERVITSSAPKANYQKVTTDATETQLDMLRKLELQSSDYRDLQKYAIEKDITFLSTPYSVDDAQFLLELGVPAFKLASIDIVNFPLLRTIASWRRPVILSSGMATLGEIEQGLDAVRTMGNQEIILLQCTTNYPIQDSEVNLCVMQTLHRAFDVVVGFSDHTIGWEIPLAAVALGAAVVEKHFTLDRSAPGPDHAASLVPTEFAQMVRGIRRVEEALGSPRKMLSPSEMENRKSMRRSLVARVPIPAGAVITEDMLALKRPGTGFGADAMHLFVEQRARVQIETDTLLTLDMVS
jgi:N-acetylneuraminate synthase/N,N'-diacetyllegionaminate synthase